MEITVASYNFYHLYSPDHPRPDTPNRAQDIEAIIREEINPHILLAQEISATSPAEAEDNISRLAEATGLHCSLQDGSDTLYTVTKNERSRLATGILWHPGIEPVGWESLEGFWHGFSVLTALMNGVKVYYGCYHGQPAGSWAKGDTRPDEAHRVVDWVRALGSNPLFVVGGDWNGLSADMVEGGRYYDFRTVYDEAGQGFADYSLDRTAGRILRLAGLRDVAAAMPGATPESKINTEPPTAKEGPRRNDIFRATDAFRQLITSYTVITSLRAQRSSDHLPPVIRHHAPLVSA